MASKSFLFSADCGENNGKIQFVDSADLQQFIEAERNSWNWLDELNRAGKFRNTKNLINGQLVIINNSIASATANPDSMNIILQTAFGTHRIPISNSPAGKFIAELKETNPDAAGAAITAWMSQPGIELTNFDHINGLVQIGAFAAQITKKTPIAVKKSLEQLNQDYKDKISELQATAKSHQTDFEKKNREQQASIEELLTEIRNHNSDFQTTLRTEADESKASIQNTEKLYKEHMKLKGPVEYWKTKSESHLKAASEYRKYLIGYGAIASIGLVLFLFWLAGHTIEVASAQKPTAIILVLSLMGVVATTIVFWVARILTRLFLSEHHLSIDSAERAVMAQTFLALTAEGQATDDERKIVLTSLFRPTADGIVKDDAAPEFSTASLISKIATK
ncbi:MAG: DUF6161 domain-containing protein [Roseibium sp.]